MVLRKWDTMYSYRCCWIRLLDEIYGTQMSNNGLSNYGGMCKVWMYDGDCDYFNFPD